LKKENPCSRTVCSHYELDAREYMSDPTRPKPFSLHGAVDACVVDTASAKEMAFWGRFGNSCGTPFDINKFCDEHIQWKAFRPYVHDRPSQDWTYFKEYDGWTEPVLEEEKEEKELEVETDSYGGKRKQKKIKKTRGGRKSRSKKGKRKTRRQRRKYMRGGEFDEEQDKSQEEITRTEQDGGEDEEVQETEVTQDELEQIEGDSDDYEEVEGDGEQEEEEPEENEE